LRTIAFFAFSRGRIKRKGRGGFAKSAKVIPSGCI
jgi:hypothetical protein